MNKDVERQPAMDRFIDTMKQGLVGMLLLGVIVYACLLLVYALGVSSNVTDLMTASAPTFVFGLPISAVAAFAVVCILEKTGEKSGDPKPLEFKAFGLAFSGPAGPVTLWVVVYLTLVVSMRLVS